MQLPFFCSAVVGELSMLSVYSSRVGCGHLGGVRHSAHNIKEQSVIMRDLIKRRRLSDDWISEISSHLKPHKVYTEVREESKFWMY
jgi:hypothetical protein